MSDHNPDPLAPLFEEIDGLVGRMKRLRLLALAAAVLAGVGLTLAVLSRQEAEAAKAEAAKAEGEAQKARSAANATSHGAGLALLNHEGRLEAARREAKQASELANNVAAYVDQMEKKQKAAKPPAVVSAEGVQVGTAKTPGVMLDAKGKRGSLAVTDAEGRQRVVVVGESLVVLDAKGTIRVKIDDTGVTTCNPLGVAKERLEAGPAAKDE